MIRGVFFDAGDVLYARECSSSEYARRLLAELGHRVDLPPGAEAVRHTLWLEATLGRIDAGDYWARTFELHGVHGAERDELVRRLDAFADDIRPAPDARRVFLELRRRGRRLGVVTDTIYPLARKMRWLEQVGVAGLLDAVACSSALGVRKPDPAIYNDALARADLAPRESAFVGHSAEELDGARAVGMTTIAIDAEDRARADHAIESLGGLLDLPILRAA